jgi:hypothetical protein
MPVGHVHHRDHNKANNDPTNLEALSAAEHTRRHMTHRRWRRGFRIPTAKRWTQWDGLPGAAAYASRQRRIAREQGRQEYLGHVARLYASGLTTVQIGEIVGRDASNITLALRAAGVKARRPGDYLQPIDREAVKEMHAVGVRASAMMRQLGVGQRRLYRVFDELGLQRFGPGRPADGEYADNPPEVTP